VPPFFYLAGPTASGKSALAVELAEALGAVIIGCDAPQLYRDLPVLSAQPEAELRTRVPHELVGILPPETEVSAGWYARAAEPLLERLRAEGRPALVCGGSGLYLRALTHGFDEFPPTPPDLRERLAALPPEAAREELLRREPEAARWIALENPRRVQRALELLETTGKSLAELREGEERPARAGIAGVVITRDRAELRERIARRAARMLENGAIEEVAAVRYLPMSATFRQVIGLREISDLLEGKISRQQCAEAITTATGRYAKRQETWFRKHAGPTVVLSPESASGLAECRVLAERWREIALRGEK
jgi:tRNA dimethylallyltransferase